MNREVQAQRLSACLCEDHTRGKSAVLNLEQKRELAVVIRPRPENSWLDTRVWTVPNIGDMLKGRFRIAYGPSQISRVRHELGFSLQCPTKEIANADKQRQPHGLKNRRPRLKKVQEDGGVLMYQNAERFKQLGSIFRHWASKVSDVL